MGLVAAVLRGAPQETLGQRHGEGMGSVPGVWASPADGRLWDCNKNPWTTESWDEGLLELDDV